MRTLIPLALLLCLAGAAHSARAQSATTTHSAPAGKSTNAKAARRASPKAAAGSHAGTHATASGSARSKRPAASAAGRSGPTGRATGAAKGARKGGGTMTSAGVLAEHPATTTAVTADAERPDSGSGRATGEAAAVAALVPGSAIALRDAPDGRSLATLSPQTSLVPVAHDRGWVRVRAEGWVKESEVSPADPTHLEISAADLRADPDGARGKLVRWDVEVLAMQTADPLRKGLLPDEPYLLARGPGPESALLYVAVPAALLPTARSVASVAPVSVALVATVRSGRSDPVGVPILDAQSLARR